MSLFDVYRPAAALACPICGTALRRWQGTGAQCGLFVWREGEPAPVDQLVDEDVRLPADKRALMRLPESFEIVSRDCRAHGPHRANCRAPGGGTWSETRLR